MKTLELKLKKELLIVDLPIDAKNVYMSGNSIIYNSDKSCIAKQINDDYEFLCKGSELTEEMARELVDETIMYEKHKVKCYRYRSYIKGFVGFDNAKESFISAVESKEKFWLENPIGNKPMSYNLPLYKIGNRCDNLKKWQEAEEKTFKNPLIFVKK